MSPYWHFLVSVGQWAQTHQEIMVAASVALVVALGLARLIGRASVYSRRRW
jgi:negative regulator of sigma E activity